MAKFWLIFVRNEVNMSGYTEIVNTLKEIRNFLQSKMTPQLMNAIQGAATAIQQSLGDPSVQANLKASLAQLNQLLTQVNQGKCVENLADIAADLHKIMKEIDPQAIGNIIGTLNNLLTEADKAGMVKNIMTALSETPELTPAMQNIICTRALAEFCYQHAPYFCFPANVPREIINGVIDVPQGLYKLCTTNPLRTGSNIYNTFFTATGRQGFVNSIYQHPIRFLTSTATSYGLSVGSNQLLMRANTYFSSAPISSTNSFMRAPAITPSLYASSTSSLVATEGIALATGTLAQQESLLSDNVANPSEQEMVESVGDVSPVSEQSFRQLVNSLESRNILNLDTLYTAITEWHQNITQEARKKILNKPEFRQEETAMLLHMKIYVKKI